MNFYDHGDPDIDAMWDAMLRRDTNTVKSLGQSLTPEQASYVPPELADSGRIPESLLTCWEIWEATP